MDKYSSMKKVQEEKRWMLKLYLPPKLMKLSLRMKFPTLHSKMFTLWSLA